MRFSFSEHKNIIHKFQKKYINFFLAALLLAVTTLTAGCGANSSAGENKKFEKYTEELFCREVSANTVSLHYTLRS